jgi:hypothetical protein
MLHACFTPIALCFVYTLWHFYAFSGTNLLTRCHSASFLFSAIFVFQKSYTGNILGIGRNEAQVLIFPRHETESKEELEGGQEVATPPGGVGAPWARHPVVWDPLVPSDIAPTPILSPQGENPRGIGVFPRKVPQCRHRRRPILGGRSLCSGTVLGQEIAPRAISIDSTAISINFTDISIDVAVSHDEEGVVLPWG